MSILEELPSLVLTHVTDFLNLKDTISLSQTCSHLHSVLPHYVPEVIKGKDFKINGPSGGHWAPELYFDAPPLKGSVKQLTLSLSWVDQGWGNRKGEIFIKLMKPKPEDSPGSDGPDKAEVVAEKRGVFGIAKHEREEVTKELTDREPIIKLARSGYFYRFMRNAGGGGGHSLTVKNFRVIAFIQAE